MLQEVLALGVDMVHATSLGITSLQTCGPTPDLPNQDVRFTNIPCDVYLKLEKNCSNMVEGCH